MLILVMSGVTVFDALAKEDSWVKVNDDLRDDSHAWAFCPKICKKQNMKYNGRWKNKQYGQGSSCLCV